MTDQPLPNRKAEDQRRQQAEEPSRSFYADLCALKNLQQAYAHLKENARELGIDLLTFETLEVEEIDTFLKQLSNDLRARTYKPAQPVQQAPATSESERGGAVAVRDLVVQAALKRLLEPVFPPAFPSDPEPEKTIKWLAGNIERGFSRVYAINVQECLGVEQHKRLLATVRQQVDDPDLLHLLASMLAAFPQLAHSQQGLLAPLLADIALEGIDPILQQTKAFGREGNFLHVHCTRVANELVILVDHDPRYDWLLPAVRKRLREELAKRHYDLAAVETQSTDLTRGGQLRFLGFELRLVKKGRQGEMRVRYRRVEETQRSQADRTTPRRRRRYHPLRFLYPCASWIGRQWPCQVVLDACQKLNAIQVGWRHLSITLFPVLLFFFGWRSPVPWLCLAAIFLCNWRWTLGLVRGAGVWAWRHKLDTVLGVCILAALITFYPLASELHANLSRESATPSLPADFYLGRYNKGSLWDAEWVHYGLYVPPHLLTAAQ